MSVLTAPNYNLHLVLREYLTGGTHSNSHLVNSRGSKFKVKQYTNNSKISEFENKPEVTKQLRSKNNLISSDELKFLEKIPKELSIIDNDVQNNNDSLNNKIVNNYEKNPDLSKNINLNYSDHKVPNEETLNQTDKFEKVDILSIQKILDAENSNKFHRLNLKSNFDIKNLNHKLILNNLQKIKRTLQREVKRLKTMIEETKLETEDTNKKCNIVAMEKIELIEENEAIDV